MANANSAQAKTQFGYRRHPDQERSGANVAEHPVVVVGAGPVGLSLAIDLAQRGQRVVLLDEPSMGLAPKLIQQIFSIIKEINEQGTTVLLVEQNAAQALKAAHQAHVLETGELVRSGTGAELAGDDSVRAAYLGGDI